MKFLLRIGTADPLVESAVLLFKRADKPSSVIRFPEWMTIYLGHWLPNTSCSQPERDNEAGHLIRSYLALLQMGFTVPCLSPNTRWALTPPFHPYQYQDDCSVRAFGGLFSVAQTPKLPPGGYYPRSYPEEPGLSSTTPVLASRRDGIQTLRLLLPLLLHPSKYKSTSSTRLLFFHERHRKAEQIHKKEVTKVYVYLYRIP